jgi:hypothetical protein
MVNDVIESRDVEAGDNGQALQQLWPRAVLLLLQDGEEGIKEDFRLANGKEVEDPGKGLGIEKSADAAAEEEGIILPPFPSPQRDAAEFEDEPQVESVILEGEGDGDEVEISQRPARFEGEEGIAVLLMLNDIVRIGEEEALAEGVFPLVEEVMNGQEAEVAHGVAVAVGVDQSHGQAPAPGRADTPLSRGKAAAGFIEQFTAHYAPYVGKVCV